MVSSSEFWVSSKRMEQFQHRREQNGRTRIKRRALLCQHARRSRGAFGAIGSALGERALFTITSLQDHGVRDDVSRQRLPGRSEEHTSELQSRFDLVCRLLLEKKKKNK